MTGIMFEGLIFGGAAIAWGVWELLMLRKANRRAEEKTKPPPTS